MCGTLLWYCTVMRIITRNSRRSNQRVKNPHVRLSLLYYIIELCYRGLWWSLKLLYLDFWFGSDISFTVVGVGGWRKVYEIKYRLSYLNIFSTYTHIEITLVKWLI